MMKFHKAKDYICDKWSIWVICAIYTILGILLTQNEMPMDHWIIEASADGLFGNNNTSLWVLCSNYIITGLIWILSKTGLRLFWLNIIFVFFIYISNVLVGSIIKENLNKNKYNILVLCLYLTVCTPFLFYTLNFTICAAYFISCGLVWIVHCIEKNKRKIAYIPGYICFVFGFSIRWDCVLFGGAFVIALLIIYMLYSIKEKNFKQFFSAYFPPFILVLLIFVVVTVTYFWGLNYVEEDFNRWNSIRTQVDDYTIPSYEKAQELYEKIGLSQNDYEIIQSWNNYDLSFFDEDLYSKIIQIRDTYSSQNEKMSMKESLGVIVYNILDNSIVIIGLILLVLALIMRKKSFIILNSVFLIVYFSLVFYFLRIGRFIYRIEYSLILSYAIVLLYIWIKTKIGIDFHNRKIFLITIVIMLIINPTKGSGMYNTLGGKSVVNLYRYLGEKEDIFGKYLYNKCFRKDDVYKSVTLNYDATEYILSNKDNFYFEAFCDFWKQAYPLTDMDIFRTGSKGVASNLGVLGLYIPKLSVMQNNFKNYGIDLISPYKQLTNDNVYVLVRDIELYDRSKEICIYLQEHYDDGITMSIVDSFEDVKIVKYVKPIDTEGMNTVNLQDININYYDECEYPGFAKLEVTSDELKKYDKIWVQISDANGKNMRFEMGKNEESCYTYIYDSLLDAEEEYPIELITKCGEEIRKIELKGKWEYE